MFQKKSNDPNDDQSKTPSPFLKNSPVNNSNPKGGAQPKEDLVIHSMSKDLKEADKGFSGADLKNIVKPAPIENKMKVEDKAKKEIPPFSQVRVSNQSIPPKTIPNKPLDKKPDAPKEKTYSFSFSANKEEKSEKKPENKAISSDLLKKDSWQKNNNLSKKEDIYVKGDKGDKTEKKEEGKEHHGLGKVITFAVVLSVILIAGAGGYYFWMTRMNGNENPPENIPNNVENNNSNPVENNKPVLPSFSTTGPNYLKMDFTSADKSSIESVLKENMDKVYESKIAVPVEFILTDNENNPITFSDFAKKANIVLSKGVADSLEDSFSVYVYVDNDMPRIGIAVDSGSDAVLKKALLVEEKGLMDELSVLFAGTNYSPDENAVFKSSKYMENDIRYINVPAAQNLSIDYTVSDNQWVIGTSQMTLHAILDSMSSMNNSEETEGEVNSNEENTENSTETEELSE